MPVMMIAVGLVLLLVSLAFKVSAAPFHFWTRMFMTEPNRVHLIHEFLIVKAAGFFAFLRLFQMHSGLFTGNGRTSLCLLQLLLCFIGNITAVFQQSVKRMLAYSSIAQAGFMLFGLLP